MKSLVIALSLSLMSVSAIASENYTSVNQLPEGSVIEALTTTAGAPVCPKNYLVGVKRCWVNWKLVRCGTYCSKITPPSHNGKN